MSGNGMNEPVNYQIIKQDGRPAFAVVPYKEFMTLLKKSGNDVYFPDEIVRLHVIEGMSLPKAWRTYKGLTQKEVAKKAGISQPALVQMEQPGANMRKDTLLKLAKALELDPEQLAI
jgi:DNA-binding XRE family transcriptional regulator